MDLQFEHLIDRYLTNSLNAEEEDYFIRSLDKEGNREILDQRMKALMESGDLLIGPDTARMEKNLAALLLKLPKQVAQPALVTGFRLRRLLPWAAAAAILVLCLVVVIRNLQPGTGEQQADTERKDDHKGHSGPGRSGAILTLADGTTVDLDSLYEGVILEQGGTSIKMNNGAITYLADSSRQKEVTWNTISIPRGRQFKLVLPDGTIARLNAASSIRYPTAFTGTERKVEISGEVYFEVPSGQHAPFRVSMGPGNEILVLGTDFNVNAYANESGIRTTLLNGKVKVISGVSAAVLKPGESALASVSGKEGIVVSTADIEKETAWIKGVFNLEGIGTAAFMRQLERWYDLDVVYKNGIPEKTFHGKLGRDLQLEQVLEVLSQFGIRYQLNGKTLTIE